MNLVRAFVIAACMLILPSAWAQSLVDTRWLAKHLESPDVLILDAQPSPLHAKSHIPGAVPVDVMAIASFGVRDVGVQQLDRMYQSLTIDSSKRVVIYDQGGTWFAPRLFFQLHYHGFPVEKLAILDGGMAKWQAEGLPQRNDPTPAPKPGLFRITSVNEQDVELITVADDPGEAAATYYFLKLMGFADVKVML